METKLIVYDNGISIGIEQDVAKDCTIVKVQIPNRIRAEAPLLIDSELLNRLEGLIKYEVLRGAPMRRTEEFVIP